MEFRDYIKSLPNQREKTMDELAELCRVSKTTVYRWIKGDFTPDPLKQKVIAEFLNISEKELFPND